MRMGWRLEAVGRSSVKIVVASLLMAFTFLAACVGPGSGQAVAQEQDPPRLDAKAWVLVDPESGKVLLGENRDQRLPMASTAKIMSVLVALEEDVNPKQEVTVSENAASYARPPYSNAGLYPFDRVSVEELIKATLVPSGIDAVYALAEEVGSGSADRFVDQMNAKAESMNLENTRFENPAGIDAPNQYSSARDLAEMTIKASEYRLFNDAVDDIQTTITTQDREITLTNTNLLLQYYPPATGVKTGTTVDAGENLVSSASEGGESYVAVVLGSGDRYVNSEALLEYAFDRYERRPVVERDKVYEEAELPYRPDESVKLAAGEEVSGLVDGSSKIERHVSAGELPPSAEAGDRLGKVEVFVDGQSMGESPLVAAEGYEEASFWQKTGHTLGGWMSGLGNWLDGLVQ